MTELAAILVPVLVLIAVFVSNERASRQQTEAHRALLDLVTGAHDRDRESWARERQLLLNRIKPETAQAVPLPGPQVTLPAVGFDDDEDFWESKDPTAELSTSELADRLMQLELEERDGVPG